MATIELTASALNPAAPDAPHAGHPNRQRIPRDHRSCTAGDASTVTITLRSTSSLGALGAGLFAVLKPQARRDNERSVRNLAELATRELSEQ